MSLEVSLVHQPAAGEGADANTLFVSRRHWARVPTFPGTPTLYEDVVVKFTKKPQDATNVCVVIIEDLGYANDDAASPGGSPGSSAISWVGSFEFDIRHGAFENVRARARKERGHCRDPLFLRIWLETTDKFIWLELPEAYRVKSHCLVLGAEGLGTGTKDTFIGSHAFEIKYPMALVAPEPKYHFDTIQGYDCNEPCRFFPQWRDYDPMCRTLLSPTIQRTSELVGMPPGRQQYQPGQLKAAAFNETIEKIGRAAERSGTGVVFVATGHFSLGDDGAPPPPGGGEGGWVYLAPEDRDITVGRVHKGQTVVEHLGILAFRSDDLIPNDIGEREPNPVGSANGPADPDVRVRLDALDRLCDRLHVPVPELGPDRYPLVRRLVIHACRSGLLPMTLQAFANRLQVPVVGHRWWVVYSPFVDWEYPQGRGCQVRNGTAPHTHGHKVGYGYTRHDADNKYEFPDSLHYLQSKHLMEVHYPQKKVKRWPPPP
jgi:hypothetical protein